MADFSKAIANSSVGVGGVQNGAQPTRASNAVPKPGEATFKDALNGLSPLQSTAAQALGELAGLNGAQAGLGATRANPIKFSNHAVERMQSRGIRYSPETMARIENAIDKAAAKGSQNTLVLTDDSALIVGVNNRTVVTVMDKQNLKENVFTKIDSTVVL